MKKPVKQVEPTKTVKPVTNQNATEEKKEEENAAPIDAFNKMHLDAHNAHRANHGVPPVKYSAELAKDA